MPIKSFGLIVKTLDASQHARSLIQNLNELVHFSHLYSPIVFYQFLSQPPPMTMHFARMQQHHAWDFQGALISTDITTTQILNQCITPIKKFFYVYDLEWLYLPCVHYKVLKDIYTNPSIELIARSSTHFNILSQCWKTPISILQDYNYEEIISIVN